MSYRVKASIAEAERMKTQHSCSLVVSLLLGWNLASIHPTLSADELNGSTSSRTAQDDTVKQSRTTLSTEPNEFELIQSIAKLPEIDHGERSIRSLLAILEDRDLVRNDWEGHIRRAIFLALGRCGESAIPYLAQHLTDAPELAMQGLSSMASDRARQILEEQAHSNDNQYRYYAVHALAMSVIGDTTSSATHARITAVLEHIQRQDTDEYVRQQAAEALAIIAEAEHVVAAERGEITAPQ